MLFDLHGLNVNGIESLKPVVPVTRPLHLAEVLVTNHRELEGVNIAVLAPVAKERVIERLKLARLIPAIAMPVALGEDLGAAHTALAVLLGKPAHRNCPTVTK